MVDIVSIGYEWSHYLMREDYTMYLILWVDVKPGSTLWKQGYAVATSCREILQQHGIDNVHCEIKESEFCLAVDEDATTSGFKFRSMPCRYHEQTAIHLTDFLGTLMALLNTPSRGGIKGLYLRRKNTDAIFALTYRHVLFDEKGPNTEYNFKSDGSDSSSSKLLATQN